MIQLHDISVSIQNFQIFDKLTLTFETGISYLITGNNGSGKTTLLKLLAGDIQRTSGSITYDFINQFSDWETKYELRKKNIHFVSVKSIHDLVNSHELFYQQRYYEIENSRMRTVQDYLGNKIQNLAKVELPESFQIEHLLRLELTRLSNGQVKKVVILKRLLDFIPRILLLDYPFEGLDVRSRHELSQFLDNLTAQHHIQLIIADHEHAELPKAVTQKITLGESRTTVSSLAAITADPFNITTSHLITEHSIASEPIVEMQNVKIQYDDKILIEGLNWKICRGERWALTGRNGSGKTTLFSLIFADHPLAYSEKVFLFGYRRGTGESIWDIKRRINYLGPEQIHFLDHSTLQLSLFEFLQRTRSAADHIDQLCSHFHASHLMSKQLKQLSNGQMQLALLLGLFLSQKELILLDEPFQFLDPLTKSRVNNYVLSHLNESTTLVLITHYEKDIDRWAHHRLHLDHRMGRSHPI